jgi:RimJ/RimL family protein N-acetyltransferase
MQQPSAAALPMHSGFSTQRLVFTPISEADAPLFCDLYCDPQTMRFISQPMSRERAARAFHRIIGETRQAAADQVFFTMSPVACQAAVDTDASADAFEPSAAIGISSIHHIDSPNRRAEAGIVLGSQHWDRGYAREILAGLIQFAFERLPLDEIWVQIHADHTVVEKLVVSVGLSKGSTVDAYDPGAAIRIWSAHRDTWSPPLVATGVSKRR